MHLADTFHPSLNRLTQHESGLVFSAMLKFLDNPQHPSLSVHQLDRVSDPNFRSLRASSDIRIIFHLLDGRALFCYAGHHDDAYDWAARRRISTHPRTGAVVIRETIEKEIFINTGGTNNTQPALFAHISDDILLRCGLTDDQLPLARAARDDDAFLLLCETLPSETAERLLDLYSGILPTDESAETASDPFDHPDTLRRFMSVTSREELEAAFAEHWEAWTVFLHPEQRRLVSRRYAGPARVSGSAGTGKTVVALHRALRMALDNPDERILLTTISDALATALANKLNTLTATHPRAREQIEVVALDTLAARIEAQQRMPPALTEQLGFVEQTAAHIVPHRSRYTATFVAAEWHQVVDAWQITSHAQYLDFKRNGRLRRLSPVQRGEVWSLLEQISARVSAAGIRTTAQRYGAISAQLRERPARYAAVIVDEAQDVTPYHLQFLAALMHDRLGGLFFAGDTGQQIFQMPFSWSAAGVNIRGRASLLKVNYRTSHQIRRLADSLLADEIMDVDGNPESRRATHSVFSGPPPVVHVAGTVIAEAEYVGAWVRQRIQHGIAAKEIAIIVRSAAMYERAKAALEYAGVTAAVLDARLVVPPQAVAVVTMHLAKGLEFRSVVVMACDDDVIPDISRFESDDPAELNAVNDSERQLLYVAMTRARDELLLTAARRASEFLVDLEAIAARGKW